MASVLGIWTHCIHVLLPLVLAPEAPQSLGQQLLRQWRRQNLDVFQHLLELLLELFLIRPLVADLVATKLVEHHHVRMVLHALLAQHALVDGSLTKVVALWDIAYRLRPLDLPDAILASGSNSLWYCNQSPSDFELITTNKWRCVGSFTACYHIVRCCLNCVVINVR